MDSGTEPLGTFGNLQHLRATTGVPQEGAAGLEDRDGHRLERNGPACGRVVPFQTDKQTVSKESASYTLWLSSHFYLSSWTPVEQLHIINPSIGYIHIHLHPLVGTPSIKKKIFPDLQPHLGLCLQLSADTLEIRCLGPRQEEVAPSGGQL